MAEIFDPPALVELPDLVRGDTYRPEALRFINMKTREILPVVRALMKLKTLRGEIIHAWSLPQDGSVDEDDWWHFNPVQRTDAWPACEVQWDVKVTYQSGDVQTLIRGGFKINE